MDLFDKDIDVRDLVDTAYNSGYYAGKLSYASMLSLTPEEKAELRQLHYDAVAERNAIWQRVLDRMSAGQTKVDEVMTVHNSVVEALVNESYKVERLSRYLREFLGLQVYGMEPAQVRNSMAALQADVKRYLTKINNES